MRLQDEVIKSKEKQVEEVQAVVKMEFKSFSDAANQNSQEISGKKLQTAMKSAVYSDQCRRCIMMFGLEENKTQVLMDTVNQVLGTVFEEEDLQ